jgi:AcrR family transcriptional regulator
MASSTARERLLTAAEDVLRTDGVRGLSVRRVTSRAGMNVAAVNYEFGSKEALLAGLLERLVEPLTQERIRRLDALSADADVPAIVRAFVEPLLTLGQEHGSALGQLLRHVIADNADDLLRSGLVWLAPGVRRFEQALSTALPGIGPDVLHFRVRLLVGTTLFHQIVLTVERGTPAGSTGLIDFLVAGIAASQRSDSQ